MPAIGLIETRGLIYAIECVDIMLKTSNVTLLNKTIVGGGLVTISVVGDVGAVTSAVNAGVLGVKNINKNAVISHHIIPRPHDDLSFLYQNEESTSKSEKVEKTKEIDDFPEIKKNDISTETFSETDLKNCNKQDIDNIVDKMGIKDAFVLIEKLNLYNLRKLAKEYENLKIDGYASRSNKNKLLEAYKLHYKN